jgi:hypothetical protein
MEDYETSSSSAYRCSWIDGRYGDGEPGSFTENLRLAAWETPSERLEYYRGHRAGRELRQQQRGLLLRSHRGRAVAPYGRR